MADPADPETDAPDPDAVGDRAELQRVSRRDVLRRAGLAGAAVVGGGVLAHEFVPHRHASADEGGYPPGAHPDGVPVADDVLPATAHGYGHGIAAPTRLRRAEVDRLTFPPAHDGRRGVTREYDLSVTEQPLEVADGVIVDAWAYGGQVPGPVVRATEGDRLRVHMANRTRHAHNVHLHGRHDPAMDGWEPVPPGSSFTYDVIAEPAGLHPYHCHVAPVDLHIGRGLYGAMIVDPPEGRPPAREVVLVIGGWDLDGNGRSDLVTFNGIAGMYDRFPITVGVDEPVRVYLVNLLEGEPVVSFHLHAQTFDVFRSGTRHEPDEHTDIVTLGQGERVVLEFSLPRPGRYMFHPHQSRLAARGAMGWFAAV